MKSKKKITNKSDNAFQVMNMYVKLIKYLSIIFLEIVQFRFDRLQLASDVQHFVGMLHLNAVAKRRLVLCHRWLVHGRTVGVPPVFPPQAKKIVYRAVRGESPTSVVRRGGAQRPV